MPAAVAENAKPDRAEQMSKILKCHILRERARKKQEREAEVEEERLRKEREAREQQDVMTLGETKDQIAHLEAKLTQLKEEKHQLFLHLKKVLNEDDNRRRQLVKENSEIITIQTVPTGFVNNQLYITPTGQRVQQPAFKTTVKRPRSPSPPSAVPVSLYHQNYNYKPPTVVSSYQSSPQKDDGRRSEFVRAVLWNKTHPYSSQPSAFYPVPPQDLPLYYPSIPSREASKGVYDAPRPQTFHLEQKIPEHYGLRTPSSHAHVLHSGALAINPAPPPSKAGSITAGYPVRSQTQYQPSAPASLYTAQSRPLYQSPGAPMSYPPRD